MKRLAAVVFFAAAATLAADTGVLVPSGANEPQPSRLSLEEMHVRVEIDEGFAKTSIRQIFRNRTYGDLEGTYEFFIPEVASISQFAIWEDGVRLPGVVLEKRRAERIYEEITARRKDPGLLRQAEEERRNIFSVKVFPIPGLGTKRIEMEYTEELPVDSLSSHYLLALKPSRYRVQSAEYFTLEVAIRSQLPISGLDVLSRTMPLAMSEQTRNTARGSFSARTFPMAEDFSLAYRCEAPDCFISFLPYRNTDTEHRIVPLFSNGRPLPDTDGYFLARITTNLAATRTAGDPGGKLLVVLADLSLSMRWEKLDRAWEVLDGLLHRLGPKDSFRLVAFNDRLAAYPNDTGWAAAQDADAALAWLGNRYQAGGTDLAGALLDAVGKLAPSSDSRRCAVVAVTDGHPTASELSYGRIQQAVVAAAKKAGVPVHVFGVGDDTNVALLEPIAKGTDGAFLWVRDTEDVGYKTAALAAKLDDTMVAGATLAFEGPVNRVYPVAPQRFFNKSSVKVVGRYSAPQEKVPATLNLVHQGKPFSWARVFSFPVSDLSHPGVPRLWARARVDELLRLMRAEGERDDWIEEIISLSKQYNFITPYTAFLAAPRSLLRPRVMKPGDPVLRVKTPPHITRVVAVFPFGLVKALRYDAAQGLWETRFLAPPEMQDGSYACTLLLTDADGRVAEEKKSFLIDSKPPALRVTLAAARARAGKELEVRAYADADTRTIRARIHGGPAVDLRYDHERKASIAMLPIPTGLPAGRYDIQVTAEDFAHNCTLVSVPVEVAGL